MVSVKLLKQLLIKIIIFLNSFKIIIDQHFKLANSKFKNIIISNIHYIYHYIYIYIVHPDDIDDDEEHKLIDSWCYRNKK